MLNKSSRILGVDLGFKTINFSVLSLKGFLFNEQKMLSPAPFLPGAVTVEICESVSLLDPLGKVDFIGIFLPRDSETNTRMVGKIVGLPYWLNVPLAEWLEIRLRRKAIIVNSLDFNSSQTLFEQWINCEEVDLRRSFLAAFMAWQYFKDIDYGENK